MTATIESHPPERHVGLHRLMLALMVPSLPLLGFLLDPATVVYDSMAARWALAALSAALLGVSFVVPHHVRLLLQVAGYASFLWFTYAHAHNGLPASNAVGLLVLVCLISAPIQKTWQLAVVILTVFGAGLFLHWVVVDPQVSVRNIVLMLLLLSGGLGYVGISTSRLERQLHEANSDLEAKVQERTDALRATVARLDAEAVVREEAERRALAASAAKSEFLANMSHELRTPLNAILGYTEIVQEEAEDLDRDDMVDDLQRVHEAANHLVGLIDAVLDLSRIEQGEVDLCLAPHSLRAAVTAAASLVPGLSAGSLTFRLDVPDVSVIADEQALRQVLVNLLANAVKFTPAGQVTVSGDVSDAWVRIAIADSGIGIPEAQLAKVFERFEQGDASRTKVHGGVGLGLAITRQLVEGMGGRIEVASQQGEGTTFTVTLPAAD